MLEGIPADTAKITRVSNAVSELLEQENMNRLEALTMIAGLLVTQFPAPFLQMALVKLMMLCKRGSDFVEATPAGQA